MANAPIPLTPELSKRARRELGLSQNDVIKGSGVQAYKLKQWEARGLAIELADIRKLTAFYEAQGVDLAELAEHVGRSTSAGREGQADNATEVRPALPDGFTYTPRPGFIISDQLASGPVDALMERMEANDDRIGELTAATFQPGFFSPVSEDSEAKVSELITTLAENYLIFRCLQGRNVIAPAGKGSEAPKTVGNYVAQCMQGSPAFPLIAGAIGTAANGSAATGGITGKVPKTAKVQKAFGQLVPAEATE